MPNTHNEATVYLSAAFEFAPYTSLTNHFAD